MFSHSVRSAAIGVLSLACDESESLLGDVLCGFAPLLHLVHLCYRRGVLGVCEVIVLHGLHLVGGVFRVHQRGDNRIVIPYTDGKRGGLMLPLRSVLGFRYVVIYCVLLLSEFGGCVDQTRLGVGNNQFHNR